jgi:hypothetical protein
MIEVYPIKIQLIIQLAELHDQDNYFYFYMGSQGLDKWSLWGLLG